MKRNWKSGKTLGLTVLPLLFFAACKQGPTDHSKHGANVGAYQCPMKCEGEKTYPKPIACPVCNMDLKPAETPVMPYDTVQTIYTCPMHPEIARSEPGRCPICKMDLVKKAVAESAAGLPDSLVFLLKPTYAYVLSNIRTIHPERKSLAVSIESPGYLTYNAQQIQAISARFSGRVERLYVRYAFQPVRKGQHILDLYSPEIATAQQDLIFLLENDPGNSILIENARQRLSLLGLSAEQIQEAEAKRKPSFSLPVFSPYAGLVFEKAMPPTIPGATEMGEKMEPLAAKTPPSSTPITSGELSLREGMYVQKGQRLFSLQSLSTVWAILEFYPSDAAFIKVGQPAHIQVEPFGKPFSGKINYIEPQFGAGGKNLRARVYLENPGSRLKPGALLKASVRAGERSGLWIPRTAVLDLGRAQVVFLKKDGVFQTLKIEAGGISGNWLEVRSGITEMDEIAADAQFLMDSESFVKFNITK